MFSRICRISTGKIRPDRFMRKKVFLYIFLNETEIKKVTDKFIYNFNKKLLSKAKF